MLKSSLASLLDQAVWALTNFLLVALAAHALTGDRFGSLALGTTIVVFLAGLCSACAGEPFAVGRGRLLALDDGRATLRSIADLRASANAWVLMLAVATPFAVIALPAAVGANVDDLVLLAGFAPLAVAAEGLRAMAYAQRLVPACLGMSFAWATAQALVTAALWAWRGCDLTTVVVGWGVGAALAAVLGLRVSGACPRFAGNTDDGRRRRAFSFEYVATAGVTHATALIAAASLGLAEAGALRAIQTVFGPLNIVIVGIRNALVPTAARHFRGHALVRVGMRISAITLVVTALVVGLLALAPPLGQLLMGSQWVAGPALLLAFGGGRIALALTVGALVVLRASDETRMSSVLRVVTAVAILGPFVACLPLGLVTALWASAAGGFAAATAWWVAAITSTRAHDHVA